MTLVRQKETQVGELRRWKRLCQSRRKAEILSDLLFFDRKEHLQRLVLLLSELPKPSYRIGHAPMPSREMALEVALPLADQANGFGGEP